MFVLSQYLRLERIRSGAVGISPHRQEDFVDWNPAGSACQLCEWNDTAVLLLRTMCSFCYFDDFLALTDFPCIVESYSGWQNYLVIMTPDNSKPSVAANCMALLVKFSKIMQVIKIVTRVLRNMLACNNKFITI